MTISNALEEAGPSEPGDGAPFGEPWQAQVFAMTVELHRQGAFTWPEWSTALGARIAAAEGGEYYAQWLDALESILLAKGVADAAALARLKSAWAKAYHRTPHGKPVVL